MAAPAHYLAHKAEENAIAAAREMIKPLIKRIERLEAGHHEPFGVALRKLVEDARVRMDCTDVVEELADVLYALRASIAAEDRWP